MATPFGTLPLPHHRSPTILHFSLTNCPQQAHIHLIYTGTFRGLCSKRRRQCWARATRHERSRLQSGSSESRRCMSKTALR